MPFDQSDGAEAPEVRTEPWLMRIGDRSIAILSAAIARLGRGRITTAAIWTVGSHLWMQVVRIGGQLVLARLLAPEMFGVMALVLTVQVVLGLLTDVGLRPTVFNSRRGDDPLLLNTLWTVQALRGLLIWLALLALAAALAVGRSRHWLPAASAWAAPGLPQIMAAAGFVAVVSGLQSTNLISANRRMDLRPVVMVELVTQFVGVAAMIALAYATHSIWALVVGSLLQATVSTVLSHVAVAGITNRVAWDRDALAELYGFGRALILSSVAFVVANNVDRVVLGGLVDAAGMGLYSIALNLTLIVNMLGDRVLANVALPALSEVARNEPARARSVIRRMRWPLDGAFLAASGLFFAMSQSLVNLVYDHRYAAAGPLLHILSLSLVWLRFNIYTTAYIALGRPAWTSIANVAKLGSVLLLMTVGYRIAGFSGAVAGIAWHGALTLPLLYWFNEKLRLNDLVFELMVLPLWLAGYVAGLFGNALLGLLHH